MDRQTALLLLGVTASGFAPSAFAQATLSLASASAPPGETVELALSYSGDAAGVATQMDVRFDGERLAATVLPGADLGGNELRAAEVAVGHWRLVVYPPAVAPLGSEIARLRFVVEPDAALGAVPITLEAAVVSNGLAAALPVTLVPGSLEIVSPAPPVVSHVTTVPDPGDGGLEPGDSTAVAVTQLVARFDTPMRDPAGDGAADDVTNPANYRLVRDVAGDGLATASCAAPIATGDGLVPVSGVTFDAASRRATLQIPGLALPAGRYRLFACGTLVSTLGTPLDGNANGTGGDDFVRDFAVAVTDRLQNPNFDTGLAGWTVTPASAPFAWTAEDAETAPTSGGAELLAAGAADQRFALGQCVAVAGGSSYRVGGRLRLTSAFADLPRAFAEVRFFVATDCSGTATTTETTPAVSGDTADGWVSAFLRTVPSPTGARSAQVSFVLDAGTAPAFTTELDHLVFFESGIFGDGFETGNLARWSVHVP